MTSYHEYNKVAKAKTLVDRMLTGQTVACVTDAGTPGISDPGEVLVQMAMEAGIQVVPVPGACAAVNALISSGQATRRFCFEAFDRTRQKQTAFYIKPKKKSKIQAKNRGNALFLSLKSSDFYDKLEAQRKRKHIMIHR